MAGLNDVIIIFQDGGLGKLPPEKDYFSGLIFGHVAAPAAYNGLAVKIYRSTAQAEADGIVETDPLYGEVYYHIDEFFRQNNTAELAVAFQTMDAQTLFAQTSGQVRQWGVFGTLADMSTLQTLAEDLYLLNAPCQIVLGLEGTLATPYPNLHDSVFPNVSVLIGGDGQAKGAALASSLGIACEVCLGALLGTISSAKVNESVGYVRKYNVSNGSELEKPILFDGASLDTVLPATLDELDDKGYIFLRKHIGIAGSYFNDSYTATSLTSDYVTIENNRTAHKAFRGVRAALLPELNAPVDVDPATGKLDNGYVKYIQGLAGAPLFQMQQNGELSGFSVTIDPDQNVLASSRVEVSVKLVPKGVSREIIVNMAYATNI